MSDSGLARRTEIIVEIDGVDVSEDMNKYLISMTYTDHEEDKTDDLQIQLDDREGVWLQDWMGAPDKTAAPSPAPGGFKIGDVVQFAGGNHYGNSMATTPTGGSRTAGNAKITNIAAGATHPYHLIGVQGSSNVYGWVDASQIGGAEEDQDTTQGGGLKGLDIHAIIIQRNWDSDGKDRVLDCGVFEIDALDSSGPPAQVSMKGTSLPYSSTVRNEKKTKAWEKIKLSAIGNDIAKKNSMTCMFLSSFDPLYDRREQVQISDIVFLQGLCKDAGISLKVTAKMIVMFDAAEYEQKEAVREIRRGDADVKSYRFGSTTNDTKYSKCHVSYTDPVTKKTIEYTYTPRDADKTAPTLEINEKVKTREEARQLALKRYRQKSKKEFTAEFTLVGDVRLVAGVTVDVVGWGMFDGKYIIETATHGVTGSGYALQVTLRRVLED